MADNKSFYVALHDGVEIASDVGTKTGVKYRNGAAYLDVTTVPGSPDTLDVTIEEHDPTSGKWFTIATFAQIAAGAGVTNERISFSFVSTLLRARWVLSGGSPGFTFTVGIVTKD